MDRTDAVLADLKRAGLKLTAQRLAIVRELAEDTSHPTAQELFERLRPAHPTMSFATVYNTLDALAKLLLVRPLRLGAAVRFDPNTEAHDHAVCDACGLVIDLPKVALSPSARKCIEESSGFEVRAFERTYRGLCGRCGRRPEGRVEQDVSRSAERTVATERVELVPTRTVAKRRRRSSWASR